MDKNNFKVDFVGIGAPKSATTWIYECLKEHPEICMAQGKGTHYFSSPSQKGIAFYHSFFKHCRPDQKKGEFSPSYISDSRAYLRIKEYNQDVKLIACLRNPVDRACSQYLHSISLGHRKWQNVFQAMKEDEEELLSPGLYYKHLKRFFDNFLRDNILILIYEESQENPTQFIQKIYQFLEVDSSFVPQSAFYKVAPTKFKLTKLGKFIHKGIAKPLSKIPFLRGLKSNSLIKKTFYRFADFYAGRSQGQEKELTREEVNRLKQYYIQDINKLEVLINRKLDAWKKRF